MALHYKMSQRVTPGEKGGGKRAMYPALVSNKTITGNEFCDLIGQQIRLSKADTVAFLCAMRTVLTEQALQGNIVQLDWIGSFYPRMHYHGQPGASQIKPEELELSIGFRPLLDFTKEIRAKAEFKKVK